MNKIIKAIQKGIKSGLLESGFNFSLDDLDHMKDYGLKKKKISSVFNDHQSDLKYNYCINHLWKENPPIKIGDILYDNFQKDDNGRIISLGDKSGKPIGVCCIQPAFLPDAEARFIGFDEYKVPYLSDLVLEDNVPCYNSCLTASHTKESLGFFQVDGHWDKLANEKNYVENPYIGENTFNRNWLEEDQCLSDLQGWKNTEAIIKQFGYKQPALLHLADYDDKNWYIPTIAEYGIVMAKLKKINLALNNKFDIIRTRYWTSTQASERMQWIGGTGFYLCGKVLKTDINRLRYFYHAEISPDFKKE